MANLIDILINAKWTGGAATGKASADLRQLGNNATASSSEIAAANTKTGLSFGALSSSIFAVTAAVTAVTIAAGKLGRAIVQGAEIDATIIRFDRLADSIGTTGEALRTDLSIATQGMVSDMEALASATDFLALGLANSHDEAVRLTAVASQLGFNMNQLVLTLTNQTTMRFDALGVAVDGFEEKVEALEQAGLDADEAFKLAFIEQAEEQIERVGSRAETTAGQIDILTSSFKDLGDAGKLALAEGFSPLISFLVSGLVAANEAEAALAKYTDTTEDQIQASQELQEALDELLSTQSKLSARILGGVQPADRARQIIKEYAVAVVDSNDTLEDQKIALQEAGFELSTFGATIEGVTVNWRTFEKALEESKIADVTAEVKDADTVLKGYIETLETASGPSGEFLHIPLEDIERYAEALDITNREVIDLAFSFGDLEDAVEFFEKMTDDPSKFFEGFGNIFGSVEDTLKEMTEAVEERADLWLAFQDDLTEISEREGELRAEAEATYEERRTDLARQFGLRRADDEEDFNRRRARADAKLQSNIDKARQDSADQQVELRERANQRLADLERDHLDRMNDIIENADLQLIQAAGRLNAAAVVSIQQQRDRALEDEEESYRNTRDEITRQLERQIEAEREAAAERIRELEAYHAERQRIEDEDRAIRLQREQDAHAARLLEYERQEQERLDQIREQGEEGRTDRADQYQDFWDDREGIETDKMQDILKAESDWWDARLGLIPQAGSDISPFVGPNATNLPPGLLQGGTSTGDITVNVNGGDSPAATGDAVRDALLQLFGGF